MTNHQKIQPAGMSELNIAIIFPAFNEELTVRGTLEEFYRELPEAQFWLVDNNSNDCTKRLAEETFNRLGLRGGILSEPRQGKGFAIRTAFLEVEADLYVMVDTDQTYAAQDVHALLKPLIEEGVDICVGDRHSTGNYKLTNERPMHVFGNNLVRDLVNLLFRQRLNDVMSGYRAMTRRFVKTCPILSSGFEIETEMTLHTLDKRLRLLEIPVQYRARPQGSESKLNTIQDGILVVRTIVNVFRHYRPLVFFSSTAFVMAGLGLICSFPVFMGFIQTGLVLNLPLAILATGLEISALISFAVGILLDSTIRLERLRFERSLLQYVSKSSNQKATPN